MLTEKLLQNALTGLLSEPVSEQGRLFFNSLRKSGLCSDEEISALEQEWQTMIEQRQDEGSDAAESLRNLFGTIKAKTREQTLPDEGRS